MSGEDYLRWHDGVEFDAASQTWRGYIESNDDHSRKHLTEATFAEKGACGRRRERHAPGCAQGHGAGFAD